jgi:hypothetical protein
MSAYDDVLAGIRRIYDRTDITEEQKATILAKCILALPDETEDTYPYGVVDTLEKSWRSAELLFHKIEQQHGTTEARSIFATLGATSGRQRQQWTNTRLLQLYETTQYAFGWSVEKFARVSAESRRKKPYGLPRHITPSSLRMRISRLLKRGK